MNKSEFISALEQKLKGLPREDVEQSIAFYEEMIQDRMEEGLSEEEATAAIGSVEEIAAQGDSFNYEFVCGINRRVPRVYTVGGQVVHSVVYLLDRNN